MERSLMFKSYFLLILNPVDKQPGFLYTKSQFGRCYEEYKRIGRKIKYDS